MIPSAGRLPFDDDHALFRDSVRRFMEREVLPYNDRWEAAGIVDRAFWTKAGAAGLLCPTIPPEYGGLGLDFGYNAVIDEELAYAGSSAGTTLQSDITADYILGYGSEAQKRYWLPHMISGETITAIAMTEPGTGSDLKAIRTTARRDGDGYVINGAKTYITNGQHCDLVILAAKTDPAAGARGLSLILVESDRAGFDRGRNLDKIGQHQADTSELFFNEVRVPASSLLGSEGAGFSYLMSQLPQERLAIAIAAMGNSQRAFDLTVDYTRDRKAFGQSIFDFQNSRFTLADVKTRLQVGWAHLDWAIARHMRHELTTAEASAAKLHHTELLNQIADMCLQLHGGAGYMNEYPIARLWRDARVTRIFGGTSEIMKEVIARSI